MQKTANSSNKRTKECMEDGELSLTEVKRAGTDFESLLLFFSNQVQLCEHISFTESHDVKRYILFHRRVCVKRSVMMATMLTKLLA